MTLLRALGALALMLALAAPASAQGKEPIGLFAADARIAFPGYKGMPAVATELGVNPMDLPPRGLGLVLGAHVYPARKGLVTLGIGAELLTSGRSRTREAAADGSSPAVTVHTHFSSFSPQLSLNFGSKQGWSYLSAGMGWGRLTTELAASPFPDAAARTRVINYGGGARWFAKPHLAFSVDLRFYAVNPQEPGAGRPAFPRMTIVAMSAGISVKERPAGGGARGKAVPTSCIS
jgi:hypothetical protein